MNDDAIQISEKYLLGDLVKAAIEEFKALPFAWSVLPEKDQQKVINRIQDRFTDAVRQTVKIIASDGRAHVVADVESVTFKDGIKAVLSVEKSSADRHELADATGTMVLIVLPNIGKFLNGEMPKPQADQPSLLP